MKYKKNMVVLHNGFTLIELLIVMVVVGILTAMAIPAYSGYIQKSRRTDAVVAMRAVQFAEEKYRGNNTSYGTLAQIGMASTTESRYYTLALSGISSSGYLITATAATGTSQAKDQACTTISLQQTAGTITTTPSSCWSK